MNGSNSDRHPSANVAAILNPPRRLRVVILEDYPFMADFYEMVLAKISPRFQIHKFTNGDEAWRELGKIDPALFITDIEHSGTDAWEILRFLAAVKVNFP